LRAIFWRVNLISFVKKTVPDIEVDAKPEEPVEINIPAETSESVKCQVCLESIDKFYDETTDEWMLRNAIKEKELVLIFFITLYTMHDCLIHL
jgi:hypothetical protein